MDSVDHELGPALWAAVTREIDEIADVLADGPTEPGVHRARKACKRARAAVRLIGPALGRRARRALDVAFAEIARPLGPLRDGDVLRRRIGQLGGDPARAPDPERTAPLAVSLTALSAASARVGAVSLRPVRDGELLASFAATWDAARGAGRRIAVAERRRRSGREGGDDDEAVHAWRKRVKRTWIQAGLLAAQVPRASGLSLDRLDRLQELLGDHHDLAVLDQLFSDGLLASSPDERARLASRKAALLDEALLEAGLTLAPRADDVLAWLAAPGLDR